MRGLFDWLENDKPLAKHGLQTLKRDRALLRRSS
jgi:hypothetical protein